MGTTLIEPRVRGADLKRLTASQRLFVEELLASETFNATEAARKAGYKMPRQAANKLLNHRAIRAVLGKAMQERITKCELQAEQVLRHLATALYLDPLELFQRTEVGTYVVRSLDDIPAPVRRCITKLKCRTRAAEDGLVETYIEIELMSKDGALKLAMQHLGLLGPDGKGTDVTVNLGTDFLGQLLQKAEADRRVIDATTIQQKATEG